MPGNANLGNGLFMNYSGNADPTGQFSGTGQPYGQIFDALAPRQQAQDASNERIAAMPIAYKQGVFNQVFPFIKGLDMTGGANANGGFQALGGQNTPQSALPSSSVYTPGQIQGQVNAANAQGQQSSQAQQQQASNNAAGRGFSASSPMVQALQAGIRSSTAASNADQSRQIQYGAATANAQQADTVGSLANTQWNDFNQADIARRQNVASNILNAQKNVAALISALGSLS